jgi:oligoendopeptidase F
MNVEDVAAIADIDVTRKSFWTASLNIIKKDIDRFLALTE